MTEEPSREGEDLDPIWKALSDPTRRTLLDLLAEEAKTTGELAKHFELSRFAIMKHLGVLEEAGLISVTKRGRQRWNHLNQAPLARVYERWLSKQTAWEPILDGSEVEPADHRSGTITEEDTNLMELLIVVRPDDKYPVERAIQSVVPPLYVSMPVTGRGSSTQAMRSGFLKRKPKPASQFLPKTMFQLLVPESYVDSIISAVRSALKLEGGPPDSGLGFAVVSRIEEEIVIGAGATQGANERAHAEGWSSARGSRRTP